MKTGGSISNMDKTVKC